MPRPVNAVDFWRGFALVSIFINHIPGMFYDRLTHKNLSASDSAELFVFLAGWSLRHVVGKPEDPTPLHHLIFRLGGRALTLYAAHMMIVMLAIAMLATTAACSTTRCCSSGTTRQPSSTIPSRPISASFF